MTWVVPSAMCWNGAAVPAGRESSQNEALIDVRGKYRSILSGPFQGSGAVVYANLEGKLRGYSVFKNNFRK